MKKLEKLEQFRRHLQGATASTRSRINKFSKHAMEQGASGKEVYSTLEEIIKMQKIEKKLLAYIVEEQRKLYDNDKKGISE